MKSVEKFPLYSLILLALLLPYELDKPLFSLAGLSFTNVEIFLWTTLGAGALLWLYKKPKIPRYHFVLLGAFALAMIASSLLAPTLRGNALKATLRTLSGIALMFSVPAILQTKRQAWWVVGAILAGTLVALSLGLVEVALNDEFQWLKLFRPKISTTGPFARLTSTWDYANQAAMVAETCVPLMIALIVVNIDKKQRFFVYCLLLILLLQAAILTLSRAALLTIGAILAIGWGWEILHRRWLAPQWSLPLLAFVGLFGANALFVPAMQMRLSSESDQAWYQRQITVPNELAASADETVEIDVTITNNSTRSWRTNAVFPIRIGARWLGEDGNTVYREERWELEEVFRPNETKSFTLPLTTVRLGGTYLVQWDLVEQDIAWFSDLTGERVLMRAVISGDAPAEDGTPASTEPRVISEPLPPDPTRIVLWRLGYQLWRTSPIFGIGLDNYRLQYGELLGLKTFNERLHSNNLYVETVVSFGAVGTGVFFVWCGMLAWDFGRKLHARPSPLRIGIALAIIAYFVHGLLDYFMLFNATALLFWLLVGLWITASQASK